MRPPSRRPGTYPQEIIWLGLGMARGLRSQLPDIAAPDPLKDKWIAHWIGVQVKAHPNDVRIWFTKYKQKGGDERAARATARDRAAADVPAASVTVSASINSASDPETTASVSGTAWHKIFPLNDHSGHSHSSHSFAHSNAQSSAHSSAQSSTHSSRLPELRWHAVGMMRALEAHIPLVAEKEGFQDAVARELNLRPQSVMACVEHFKQVGMAAAHEFRRTKYVKIVEEERVHEPRAHEPRAGPEAALSAGEEKKRRGTRKKKGVNWGMRS